MRIGIVTSWFERGAAYVSLAYKKSLEAEGHKVFIYARGGEGQAVGDAAWDRERVTWAKKTLLMDESGIDLSHFKRWLSRERLEAVLFNEQRTWAPVLACHALGIPALAYVDYYTKSTVRLFSLYDGLICNTKRHYSAFDWHPGAHYIPWGLEVDLFTPQHGLEPVGADAPVFFHSCGMAPIRKGTDLLIRAFSKLDDTSSKLIIHAQKNVFSLMPDEVVECAGKLVSEGRLEILHETVSAPGLYHKGDVYVYPSRLDGIGLTICEAMACGLPAIVPDNAPMNEFVDDEVSGRLVGIKRFFERQDGYYWPSCVVDIDHLVEAMRYYVDQFRKMTVFRKNARRYAEQNFDWDTRSSAVSEVFKDTGVLQGVLREEGLALLRPQLKPSVRIRKQLEVLARRAARSCGWLQRMYDRRCALSEVSKGQ